MANQIQINVIEKKELFVSLNEIWSLISDRRILQAKLKLEKIIDSLREDEDNDEEEDEE